MTDQTISTPETREREVVALKHQVRDMANERNKAEQDVRALTAKLAAMTQDYEAACHLAESTSNEWKANKQQLAASEARVKDLEDALRQISGKTREEFYTCVGIANKALAKGKETL